MLFPYFRPILINLVLVVSASANYDIGVGIADCTGPSVEITLMGYAVLTQIGCGIHLRQFSRAFIVDDGNRRVAFVSVDAGMMTEGIRRQVLANLNELYNDTYTIDNVVLSGTHTHSGPGGFLMDLMYDVPDLGFVRETFEALVAGITQSIINAHENIVEGKIYLNSGELLDANINRSPASYLYNPEEERANYEYNVDKEMVQLKFVRSSDNVAIGAINWFAVHATSMNNTNCLLSSDNVGYASILFEEYISQEHLPGTGAFVGAFASSNLGDVSPNIKGPICIDTGDECDFVTSTCDGDAKYCIASGPGDNIVESTRIIAERLLAKAKELFAENNTFELSGEVKFIHQYVHMPNETISIELENGTTQEVTGCLPAMGYAFAAGTTDGPGDFDFTQSTLTDNPFWNAIRDLVFPPSDEQIACHAPKPILINTGEISFPYSWQPQIVSTQLLQIGELLIAAVPGEFTTMSGRRLRNTIRDTIINNDGSNSTKVVIAGLSNVYTSYIATPEEYQLQRYEGASTIFGPHTLDIYLNKYKELAEALTSDQQLDAGPAPEDFSAKLIGLVTPVLYDTAPVGRNFGDCVAQPPASVTVGGRVVAEFISGNPRNNVLQGDTFLAVEHLHYIGDWRVIANDANWETRFIWNKTDSLLGQSRVTIEWDVGEDVEPGVYRIRHFGNYKILFGDIFSYHGATNTFKVV